MKKITSPKDLGNYILFFKDNSGILGFQIDLGATQPNDTEIHLLFSLMTAIFERADKQNTGNEILKQIN